jgi:MoaA/NifB/PqqE/SkfB family radical SAM enzyme
VHDGGDERGDGAPASLCPLPWLNLSLDVDGSSRPCCKFAHQAPDSRYQMANLADATVDEVWNGEGLQRLRRDFRAGVRPAECASCWREEEAGIPSFRQTYVADRGITTVPDVASDTPERPVALDLKLSNACNLRCRICGPVASSLWLREELEHNPGLDPRIREQRAYYLSNKLTHHPADLEVLRSWVPHLEHLEMTGGEPMLSPENREVIELVATEGRPERVTLLLTTNAMVIDERIMAHLPRFASVVVSLSVDDVGPRLEYERAPAEWATVEANVARYAAMASDRIDVYANCTVSTLNVWYVPEYLDWLAAAHPDGRVGFNLNLVHDPAHYSVRNLPPALKRSVAARLRERALRPERSERVRGMVEGLLDFMGEGPADDPGAWDELVRVTGERDAIRGESMAAALPEYRAEIDRLGLWERSRPGARVHLRRSLRSLVRR